MLKLRKRAKQVAALCVSPCPGFQGSQCYAQNRSARSLANPVIRLPCNVIPEADEAELCLGGLLMRWAGWALVFFGLDRFLRAQSDLFVLGYLSFMNIRLGYPQFEGPRVVPFKRGTMLSFIGRTGFGALKDWPLVRSLF